MVQEILFNKLIVTQLVKQ